ncbi:hypothetical protein CK203_117135 [Vitis vinifera]|uniref:Uncharacterized protein n=1 Tax=Vitis vinifera TaxID=29760 RepID=A0A438C488_VITVI|nr:hypothetical protein CK203_117135 [Vitis vinifera]
MPCEAPVSGWRFPSHESFGLSGFLLLDPLMFISYLLRAIVLQVEEMTYIIKRAFMRFNYPFCINFVDTLTCQATKSRVIKRPIQDQDICKSKRQKLEEESMASDVEVHVSCKLSHIVTCERGQEHANYMHISLLSFVELLKPHVVKDKPFRPEVSLTALSMLCIVFSKYPQTNMSFFIT